MNIAKHLPPLSYVAAAALLTTVTAQSGGAADEEEMPFSVARVFFQLNDTDGDLGFHAKVDGEPWKTLDIEDPSESSLLKVRLRGRLRRQGLTEFSFESAEPNFDEFPAEDFLARFPEGEYEIEGRTLDNRELEGTSMITHVIPAPPENLQVSGLDTPDDCDEDPIPVVGDPVTISWDAVTESHSELGKAGPIEVTRYEISVEREDPALVLSADLPPDVTSFEIPVGLTGSGEEFKFQVLATDAGGNETSSESCFLAQ